MKKAKKNASMQNEQEFSLSPFGRMLSATRRLSSDDRRILRLLLTVLAVYAVLLVSYYFLADDQLRYRSSAGNVELISGDAGTVELSPGALVEQTFIIKIERLQSIGVQFGTYYRTNSGTVTMELCRLDGTVLLTRDFDASKIVENEILTITAEHPAEGLYGEKVVLRLFADSTSGEGVTPLMTHDEVSKDFALFVNGEVTEGTLCFYAEGTDYIWLGLHYWHFTIGLGVALALALFLAWRRYRSGKKSHILWAMLALQKYRFLIRQLVSRDFKIKYKRSVLGVFWSFLNPLLMMLVQYFVFSKLFQSDVPNFAGYLIIGVVLFNFFSEACSLSLTSVLENANLITKVYMPKYIYPLTRTMSSVINLGISLVPLLIVCACSGISFQKATVLSLYFFACLILFSLGLGLLLSTSMVFFRDTKFLWSVFSMMWMYATPIFYPETILPDGVMKLQQINPLYHFLKSVRTCILSGISPEPRYYVISLAFALGMLAIGALVFRRHQDKFVLYL